MTSLPGPSSSSSADSKDTSKEPLPKDWTEVGIVKKLFIYPVEGCHPKEIKRGLCTPYGLTELTEEKRHTFRDRSFVLYNEKTRECITLSNYSHLVCLKMDSDDMDTFTLRPIDDLHPIQYPLPDLMSAIRVKVNYHGKAIEVYDCGDAVTHFLSTFLLHQESGIRLGMHCKLDRRDISDSELEGETNINFKTVLAKEMHADLSNYLIIAQPSIDDILHTITNTSIVSENFRPNILLNGSKLSGFPEDNWTWIKINNVVFHKTRLCSHTETATISIRTGIKSFRDEPIRTMKPNRLLSNILNTPQDEDIPVLGVNAEISTAGTISIGDSVYVV